MYVASGYQPPSFFKHRVFSKFHEFEKNTFLTNFSFKNNPTLHLNFWSVLRENFVWTVFIHVCSCSLFVPFNNQSVTVAYFPHMLTWHQLLNSNLCWKNLCSKFLTDEIKTFYGIEMGNCLVGKIRILLNWQWPCQSQLNPNKPMSHRKRIKSA